MLWVKLCKLDLLFNLLLWNECCSYNPVWSTLRVLVYTICVFMIRMTYKYGTHSSWNLQPFNQISNCMICPEDIHACHGFGFESLIIIILMWFLGFKQCIQNLCSFVWGGKAVKATYIINQSLFKSCNSKTSNEKMLLAE